MKTISSLYIVYRLILILDCLLADEKDSEKLILLHVIHRSGSRTRDNPTFPTDPYVNETFWPYGVGELTNTGKLMAYEIGTYLRSRYNHFLGDIYHPDILEARSTARSRTMMSLQLSLAGLFPPRPPLIWNFYSTWMPIPFVYENAETDYLLGFACSAFESALNEFIFGEGVALYENDLELYDYLTEKSGWSVTTPYYAYLIYYALKAEEEWGLKLPQWTETVWKKPLREAATKFPSMLTGTTKLKRLGGGFLLKKILNESIHKINDTLEPKGRKLFIYAVHDLNIATLLGVLNIHDDKLPNYASYIIIEVLIKNVYGIRLYYQNYDELEPVLLTIPGCEPFCPLYTLVQLVSDFIPESEEECYR